MSSRWKVYRNKEKERKYNISEDLHFPFRICIVGATGSGKTNLMMNLIFEEYDKVLKRVILMAGKSDTISEMKSLHNEKKPSFDMELYKKYNDDKVNEIMDELEENHKETAFIFEDLTAFNVSKKNKNNGIDRIIMNGRQSLVSSIFTSQKYMDLNPSSRSINCSMLILYEFPDEEREKIFKEHSNGLTKEQFFKLVNDHTTEKFSFFAIDYTQPKESRFRDKNLNIIDISKYKDETENEGDGILGEVIKGAKQQSKAKKKPEPKTKDKTEKPKNVKLKKLEKGDETKMKAVFSVDGKEKVVPFGVEPRNFIEDKNNRSLRFDFIRRFNIKNETPTDPKVLERYLLFESPDLKRNLKDFKEKFKV